MDEYIIIYEGGTWVVDNVFTDIPRVCDEFTEQVRRDPQGTIEVRKMNLADGTCRDVTGDMVDLAFPVWDKNAERDEQMPYVYAKFNCEREPFTDNREHAEDLRAWSV